MPNVPVVNHDNVALAPCTEARARTLLKKGRAEVINQNPFTIRLKPATEKIAEKTMEKETTEKSQLSTPFLKHISGKWATIAQLTEPETASSHCDWALGYAQRVKEAAKSSEFSESHRSVLKGVLEAAATTAEATRILHKFDELHPRYKTLSILTSGLFSAADADWKLTPEQKEMREKLKNKWAPTGLLNGVSNENERFVLAADFELATNIIMVALDLVQESINHPSTIDKTASLVLDEMAMNTLYAIRKIYDLGFKIPEENPLCETLADSYEKEVEESALPVDAPATSEDSSAYLKEEKLIQREREIIEQEERKHSEVSKTMGGKGWRPVIEFYLPKTGTYDQVVLRYFATIPATQPHTCTVARLSWEYDTMISSINATEAIKSYESDPERAFKEKDWFVLETRPVYCNGSKFLSYNPYLSWVTILMADGIHERMGRDLSLIENVFAELQFRLSNWSLEEADKVIETLFYIMVHRSSFADPKASAIRFLCEKCRLNINCCDGRPVLDAISDGVYNPEFIYSMLDLGFDIHSHNDWLLAHAVGKGWLDVTKELIKRGAKASKEQPIFLNDPNVCRTLAMATLSE